MITLVVGIVYVTCIYEMPHQERLDFYNAYQLQRSFYNGGCRTVCVCSCCVACDVSHLQKHFSGVECGCSCHSGGARTGRCCNNCGRTCHRNNQIDCHFQMSDDLLLYSFVMTVAAGNIRRGILPLGNAILFGVTVGKWVGLMIQTFVDKK